MTPDEQALTVVPPSHHVAFASTLLAEGETGPSSAALSRAPDRREGSVMHGQLSTSLSRTTVLPRLRRSSGAPSIVTDTRERYVSDKLLGEGGVGEVVRATDNDIARPVAIKRIRNEVKSQAMLLRFVEEIRTVGQLEHPNIVPIHDVGKDENGDYFFVMKYVEGETLEDIVNRLASGDPAYHAKYTMEHRLRIFMGVLEAIAHAHSKGFVHRDIKPANVMVGDHGQVMVMDWGLAKKVGAPDPHEMLAGAPDPGRLHQTAVGALLGTPAYMSPEQARCEEATEKSDIYSLCVMLYELLTLRHYLQDCTTLESMLDEVQHRNAPMAGTVSNPYQRPPPMDLGWFLKAGLAKDPAQRFASVQAMIDRLQLRGQGIVPIQCNITFTKRMLGMAIQMVDRYPMQISVAMLVGVVSSIGGLSMLVARALG